MKSATQQLWYHSEGLLAEQQ